MGLSVPGLKFMPPKNKIVPIAELGPMLSLAVPSYSYGSDLLYIL